MNKRAIILVMDSVGIGALPDAAAYGDAGSNTLGNIATALGGLRLPCLAGLGLGHIGTFLGVEPAPAPTAAFGKMTERSTGKDTTTGHWEMAGILQEKPFPTYPQGFPASLLQEIRRISGRDILGNIASSGTAIIQALGEEHLATGALIVYTSADSVLQIAAHEDVVPLPKLYDICLKVRQLMQGEHAVARVIARPFVGKPGAFVRTAGRHDYSLKPPAGHLLQKITAAGLPVAAIGKIRDIFAGDGVGKSYAAADNVMIMQQTCRAMDEVDAGLIWANFVDFDMLYGHRNNVLGYGRALESFDAMLPDCLGKRRPKDLIFITADHGADPTTPSTDHSREYVPLLALGGKPADLDCRTTFADLGATVAQWLGVGPLALGQSMLPEMGL